MCHFTDVVSVGVNRFYVQLCGIIDLCLVPGLEVAFNKVFIALGHQGPMYFLMLSLIFFSGYRRWILNSLNHVLHHHHLLHPPLLSLLCNFLLSFSCLSSFAITPLLFVLILLLLSLLVLLLLLI